jgi:hypothetical protein
VSADLAKDDRILIDGELVTVVAAASTPAGFECIVKSPARGLFEVFVRGGDVATCKVPASDGSGDSGRAITAVWAQWMGWAIPRIRSAVLATRPLRSFAHQDDVRGYAVPAAPAVPACRRARHGQDPDDRHVPR